MAGGAEHGLDRLRVEPARLHVGAQLARGLLGRARWAVGARLAHRLVGVGGGEDPRRARDRRAGEPARIAGAVEPLAVGDRDRGERRERVGLVEHPFGQVRVDAHALPLAGAERAGLVPDRVGDAEPAEVVDEPRAPQRPHLGLRQPETRAGLCDELARPPARARACTATSDRRSWRSRAARRRTCSPERTSASPGSASITASQVPTPSMSAKISSASEHISSASDGSNCFPARAACELLRRFDAADPVRDLAELRELGESRGAAESRLPSARPGQPRPFHCSYALREGREHVRPTG